MSSKHGTKDDPCICSCSPGQGQYKDNQYRDAFNNVRCCQCSCPISKPLVLKAVNENKYEEGYAGMKVPGTAR